MTTAGRPSVLRRIRGRLQRATGRLLGWVSYPFGYDTLRRDYYSPIPDLRELPESAWGESSSLGGVKFDLDEQMAFLERDLSPFLSEFNPPIDPTRDSSLVGILSSKWLL